MDFPNFFQSFHTHMFLLANDDGSYALCPPNQCDWFFTLKKIDDDMWEVSGYRDDIFSLIGPETTHYFYKRTSDGWTACAE